MDTDSPKKGRSKVTQVVITGLCTIASIIWGTLYYVIFGPIITTFINLKMNIEDVDEKLSTRDLYGKVIERLEEIEDTHLVCFTSVPPEVDAYFQSHRQHAAKSVAH